MLIWTSFAPGAPVSASARPVVTATVIAVPNAMPGPREIHPPTPPLLTNGSGRVRTGVVVPTTTVAAVAL